MLAKFAVLSATIYQIVELAKLLYDRTNHKFNWDLGVALAFGLLAAFGVPLDIFKEVKIVFEAVPYLGQFLTGIVLGGVGAGVIHGASKLFQSGLE